VLSQYSTARPAVQRLDLYSAVHKMQRARLCRLIVETGTADPADALSAARLAAAVGALVDELLDHAAHEDQFIHPLLRQRAPAIAAELDAAHLELDAHLDQVRQIAAAFADSAIEPNALYRALASFAALYFAHVAREEEAALPALWGACSDAELAGILIAFKDSRSDTENLTSLLAQLATLSPPEIARMGSLGLDGTALIEVRELVATLLDPRQLGALLGGLPQPSEGAASFRW
jgi:iron-sulfur cluster repair protein YtfE (RIC family)